MKKLNFLDKEMLIKNTEIGLRLECAFRTGTAIHIDDIEYNYDVCFKDNNNDLRIEIRVEDDKIYSILQDNETLDMIRMATIFNGVFDSGMGGEPIVSRVYILDKDTIFFNVSCDYENAPIEYFFHRIKEKFDGKKIIIHYNGDFILFNTSYVPTKIICFLAKDVNYNVNVVTKEINIKKEITLNKNAISFENINELTSVCDKNFIIKNDSNFIAFDNSEKIMYFFDSELFFSYQKFYLKNKITSYKIVLVEEVSALTINKDIVDTIKNELSKLDNNTTGDNNNTYEKKYIYIAMNGVASSIIKYFLFGENINDYGVLDEVINKIKDGYIPRFVYDNAICEVDFNNISVDIFENNVDGNTVCYDCRFDNVAKEYYINHTTVGALKRNLDLDTLDASVFKFWVENFYPHITLRVNIGYINILDTNNFVYLKLLDEKGWLGNQILAECSLNVNNVTDTFFKGFEFIKKYITNAKILGFDKNFFKKVDYNNFYFQVGNIVEEAKTVIEDEFNKDYLPKYQALKNDIDVLSEVLDYSKFKDTNAVDYYWNLALDYNGNILDYGINYNSHSYVPDSAYIPLGKIVCSGCSDELFNQVKDLDCVKGATKCSDIDIESANDCLEQHSTLQPVPRNKCGYYIVTVYMRIENYRIKFDDNTQIQTYNEVDCDGDPDNYKKGSGEWYQGGADELDAVKVRDILKNADRKFYLNDCYKFDLGMTYNPYANIVPKKTEINNVITVDVNSEEKDDYVELTFKPKNYDGHIIIDDMLVVKE